MMTESKWQLFYSRHGKRTTYFDIIDNNKDLKIVNFFLNAFSSRVKWYFVRHKKRLNKKQYYIYKSERYPK
jgi:hypothetical protein